MTEQWLPVVGHPGYEVSDLGRARSVDRLGLDGRRLRGRVLRLGLGTNGRPFFVPRTNGRAYNVYPHISVLESFVGPRPSGCVARHKNGIMTDNRLCNLEWGTHRDNRLDSVRHGTDVNSQKTHCKWGHELSGPNLKVRIKPNGDKARQCVACCRGKSFATYWVIPVRDAADYFYEEAKRG